MILFTEIFNRAVNLFDDPAFQKAYYEDPVKFNRMMRPHLINGLSMFANPITIAQNLSIYENESGMVEIFNGNNTDTYTLTTTPVANAVFTCRVAGKIDRTAQYNATNNTIKFTHVVTSDLECSVEWYYAGSFTVNPSHNVDVDLSAGLIGERVKDILAHCTVLAWCKNQENFLLDIRNLLTDTDFQMYSPANALRAKMEWYKQTREELNDLTNKLTWDMYAKELGRTWYGK